jgi:hypothetical protein
MWEHKKLPLEQSRAFVDGRPEGFRRYAPKGRPSIALFVCGKFSVLR